MELNQAQLKAVQTIDRNLAVNAGAGTGKTKVLAERFIYLLEHGDLEEFKEIESIVAITFTNKATQEMIERIRQEIKHNIQKGGKWKRFYRDLERANISTIHGFCARILRESPMEAKIDPYFEVLDDVISAQILNESIIQVLNLRLEQDPHTFHMMRLFNQNRIENIAGDLYALYHSIRSAGRSFREVKKSTMDYINSLEIKEEDLNEVKELIQYLMTKSRKNSNLYQLQSDNIWLEFKEGNGKEDIFFYIHYIKERLGTNKKEQETLERVNGLLDAILLSKDQQFIWLYDTITDILIDIDHTYTSKKKEMGGLDYDDLQNILLKLLDNPEVLKKYQSKYRYFMIDEFQDTNQLQKKIFYKLATEKEPLDRQNLFIVGDPKQSIYGFRGADMDGFYDVIEDIHKYNKDSVFTLNMNYRSVNTLLEFINHMFSQILGDRYDELIYNKESKNKMDIEILQGDDLNKNAETASIYEADIIAKRIKILVGEGKYHYKDIALLFRASTRNPIYEQALKDYNIPYYNTSSKRFFRRQEILDILNGLKTISNPYDNIAVIGFLRGPMIGLKDTSLYWLLRNLEKNLYQTLLNMKDHPIFSKEERDKLNEAMDLLGYFYKAKNLYSLSEIIDRLIEKTMFIETSLLKAEGGQIVANIYKFIEMTNEYDSENNHSLEDYIDYIEKLKNTRERESILQSEEEDVVKLITIHSSKGLQFPVVIIPEMSKASGGFPSKMLYHKDMGIGVKTEESQGIYKKIHEENQNREAEENKRILYVAMTRAEEMLILACYGKDRGFKKLIKDTLPENGYRVVSDTEIEKKAYVPVKSIEEDLLGLDNSTENSGALSLCHSEVSPKNHDIPMNLSSFPDAPDALPLLYKMDSFNQKEFTSYNISQYQKFNQCKRRFFLDYYWGLDMDMEADTGDQEISDIKEDLQHLKGAVKGNVVHRFCHIYRNGMERDRLIQDILSSYGIEYRDEIGEQLKPYIDNFLKNYSEDYDEIYSEKEFHLKIKNKYIHGIIDRISIKDGEIELLDFKTNRIWNKNKIIQFYEPQLRLYAYAIEKILGKRVSKASILFLETGLKAEIHISEELLEQNFNKIEEFIEFVETNKDIHAYGEAEECDPFCLYKGFCQRELSPASI